MKKAKRMISIGCRNSKPRIGCIGLDAVRPDWADEHPDRFVLANALEIPFDDEYFDEVYASHVFEHVHKWQREDCLKEWWRVLAVDGILKIKVPNMAANIREYYEGRWSIERFCDMSYGLQWVDGKVHPYEYHHYGYDKESIVKYVMKVLAKETTKCELYSITTGHRQFPIPDMELRAFFKKATRPVKGKKIIRRVAL